MPRDRLDLHPLYEERFMIACAPGHRFEQREQASAARRPRQARAARAILRLRRPVERMAA